MQETPPRYRISSKDFHPYVTGPGDDSEECGRGKSTETADKRGVFGNFVIHQFSGPAPFPLGKI
jgi:hypothetical protein